MEKGETWLKLYRSMLDWEWYKNTNTKILFLHLLLIANIKPQRREGVYVPVGSVDRTQAQLSEELGISEKQVRIALKHLKETGEVAVVRHPKFSVISILQWDSYQLEGQKKGRTRADEGQTKGALNKNVKNSKEWKENISVPDPEEEEDDESRYTINWEDAK